MPGAGAALLTAMQVIWGQGIWGGKRFPHPCSTEFTHVMLMQAMVLHTSSKASPLTKRMLLGKHPWNWTFLPCKAAQQLDPCLGLEGLAWHAGETPAAEHLCCMAGPRMPGNGQLPKTSDTSCPTAPLQVQSCRSSLAATNDTQHTGPSPNAAGADAVCYERSARCLSYQLSESWSKSKSTLSTLAYTASRPHSERHNILQTKAANMKPSCSGHKPCPPRLPGTLRVVSLLTYFLLIWWV